MVLDIFHQRHSSWLGKNSGVSIIPAKLLPWDRSILQFLYLHTANNPSYQSKLGPGKLPKL